MGGEGPYASMGGSMHTFCSGLLTENSSNLAPHCGHLQGDCPWGGAQHRNDGKQCLDKLADVPTVDFLPFFLGFFGRFGELCQPFLAKKKSSHLPCTAVSFVSSFASLLFPDYTVYICIGVWKGKHNAQVFTWGKSC